MLGAAIASDDGAPSVSGSALARAAAEALREARIPASSLAAVVHDGATEQTTAEEIAMAMARLPLGGAAVAPPGLRAPPWAPAFSVGETGAAAAWLSLAMAAFFLREGVFDGPVLTWLTSESGTRGAVVLGTGDTKEVPGG